MHLRDSLAASSIGFLGWLEYQTLHYHCTDVLTANIRYFLMSWHGCATGITLSPQIRSRQNTYLMHYILRFLSGQLFAKVKKCAVLPTLLSDLLSTEVRDTRMCFVRLGTCPELCSSLCQLSLEEQLFVPMKNN
jgi:hypothetical protein